MNWCEAVERDNIIERYLSGTLEPALKEEWEEHYFGCDRCSRQLETWSAIDRPLREMEEVIRREMRELPLSKPALRFPIRIFAGVGLAAVLLVSVAIWFGHSERRSAKTEIASHAHSAPIPALAELARFDPPPYEPSEFRGIETKSESQFLDGMKRYAARDYPGAIIALQASLVSDPDSAPARFFLGACYLLTARSGEGITALSAVASGDSPFAEEAKFYLAKGYLMEGRTAEAIATLRPLAESTGDFSQEARRLVSTLTR